MENKINARVTHHRFNSSGVIPTIPLIDDITSASFSTTDIKRGEIAINLTDNKAWFRSNLGIVELTTASSSSTNSLTSVLGIGNTMSNSQFIQSNGGETYLQVRTDGMAIEYSVSESSSIYINDEVDINSTTLVNVTTPKLIITNNGSPKQYQSFTTSTVGGTTIGTSIIEFSNNKLLHIKLSFGGIEYQTGLTAIGGEYIGVFKNNSGSISSVGNPTFILKNEFDYAGLTFSSGTNNLGLSIQGDYRYTINWNFNYEYFIL